ncbi:MAG: hypothetical protein ACYDDA_09095 [Acidiferrobacteraceae bacterium]
MAHYMTTEEEYTRQLQALQCRGCSRVFLYDRLVDRKVDKVRDRAYVVCPCGDEFSLSYGNVSCAGPHRWVQVAVAGGGTTQVCGECSQVRP